MISKKASDTNKNMNKTKSKPKGRQIITNTGKNIEPDALLKKVMGPRRQKLRLELVGLNNVLFYMTGRYDCVLEQSSSRGSKTKHKPNGEITKLYDGDTLDLEVIRKIEIDK
jgi:hypothetical protein